MNELFSIYLCRRRNSQGPEVLPTSIRGQRMLSGENLRNAAILVGWNDAPPPGRQAGRCPSAYTGRTDSRHGAVRSPHPYFPSAQHWRSPPTASGSSTLCLRCRRGRAWPCGGPTTCCRGPESPGWLAAPPGWRLLAAPSCLTFSSLSNLFRLLL